MNSESNHSLGLSLCVKEEVFCYLACYLSDTRACTIFVKISSGVKTAFQPRIILAFVGSDTKHFSSVNACVDCKETL